MNDLSNMPRSKTRSKPLRKNNEPKSKAASLRFSIVDKKARVFIEQQAEKHNYTQSFTAQLIMQAAIKHCPQLIKHFLEHRDEIHTTRITGKQFKPFIFKGRSYTHTEIKVIACLLDNIKLDSVGWNVLRIWESLPSPTPFTFNAFKHVVPELRDAGLILCNSYGTTRGEKSFTLHNDCLLLVNQAIDEGYLNEL